MVLIRRLLVVAVAIAFWPVPAVPAFGSAAAAPKAFTLVLGDSVAFGFQFARFLPALPNPDPAVFNTGLADGFGARLVGTVPGRRAVVVNLACPGETTATFLGGPCPYSSIGFALHEHYAGTQIEAAEAFLATNRGSVSPILVSIGADDVLELLDACGVDPACLGPLLPQVLHDVAVNLDEILARLRLAAPDARIVLLKYYNPYAFVPGTDLLTTSFNAVIESAAEVHGARLADAYSLFNQDVATLCHLTLMCPGGIPDAVEGDNHPSDAGYAAIADLLFEAAGYTRFER